MLTPAVGEADRRAGHVQAPDAGLGDVGGGDGVVPVGLEVGRPTPAASWRSARAATRRRAPRSRPAPSPAPCRRRRSARRRGTRSARRTSGGRASTRRPTEMAWLSSRPVGTSALRRMAKYSSIRLRADVLGHPDRADRVELLVAELAVVLQPDLDLVADACLADPLARQLGLLPADRDARRRRRRTCAAAWIAIDPQPQPTSSRRMPSRWSSPSLRATRSCFAAWASSSDVCVVDEAGARVRHRRAEHDPVEVVADVVVVADRPGIAAQRVPPPLQPGLLRRRRQRSAEHADAPGRGDRLDRPPSGPKLQVLGGGVAEHLDHPDEVALDVEVARDVRPAEAELVGHPQDPADGVGRIDPQRAR